MPQSVDMDCVFSEEIDDGGAAVWQDLPEHVGRDDDAEELLHKDDDLHLEQGAELLVDLDRMELAPPGRRKVMRLEGDGLHQVGRVDRGMVFRDHAPRNSEDAAKEPNVEQDRTVVGDLEVEESIGVEDGKQNQDGGERPGDEGNEPGQDGRLGFGKPIDVFLRYLVGVVKPSLEQVIQLVELAELPPRKLGVATGADRGRVSVVLLRSQVSAWGGSQLGRLTSK